MDRGKYYLLSALCCLLFSVLFVLLAVLTIYRQFIIFVLLGILYLMQSKATIKLFNEIGNYKDFIPIHCLGAVAVGGFLYIRRPAFTGVTIDSYMLFGTAIYLISLSGLFFIMKAARINTNYLVFSFYFVLAVLVVLFKNPIFRVIESFNGLI